MVWTVWEGHSWDVCGEGLRPTPRVVVGGDAYVRSPQTPHPPLAIGSGQPDPSGDTPVEPTERIFRTPFPTWAKTILAQVRFCCIPRVRHGSSKSVGANGLHLRDSRAAFEPAAG